MLIDPSVSSQSYIEDCEICCNPIKIDYASFNDEIIFFDATSVE